MCWLPLQLCRPQRSAVAQQRTEQAVQRTLALPRCAIADKFDTDQLQRANGEVASKASVMAHMPWGVLG